MNTAISAPVRSRTSEMKIGKTNYTVTSTFSENSTESIEDKLVRFVAERISEGLKNTETGRIAGKK